MTTTPPATRQRSAQVSTRIMDALAAHANVIVTAQQLAKDTGLTTEQVSGAVMHMRTRTGIGDAISIPARGMYLYRPGTATAAKPSRRIFEEIATTRAGNILVQSEDGTLYRLSEVE